MDIKSTRLLSVPNFNSYRTAETSFESHNWSNCQALLMTVGNSHSYTFLFLTIWQDLQCFQCIRETLIETDQLQYKFRWLEKVGRIAWKYCFLSRRCDGPIKICSLHSIISCRTAHDFLEPFWLQLFFSYASENLWTHPRHSYASRSTPFQKGGRICDLCF